MPGWFLEIKFLGRSTKSHFFNTDCMSCHTKTRRALALLQPRDVTKIAAARLHQHRAFGEKHRRQQIGQINRCGEVAALPAGMMVR